MLYRRDALRRTLARTILRPPPRYISLHPSRLVFARPMTTQTDKSLVLYTFPTPHGVVPAILLEEVKAAYGGLDWETVKMNLRNATAHTSTKSPWFLEINPSGRVPAITHDGFPVFETSAILLYLAAQFDTERKFSKDPVKDPKGYSEEVQWLFFAHGGIGPMQAQAAHFNVFAAERVPYAIERYMNETRRLYGVLDARLATREYIVDTYGLADIKTFPWACWLERAGLKREEFPNVQAWMARIEAREAVKAGMDVTN